MYLISDLKYYITLGKFEIFICKFHLTSLNSENESSLYIAWIAWFIARNDARNFLREFQFQDLQKIHFKKKQKNCQINKQIGQLGRKLFPKNAIEMI